MKTKNIFKIIIFILLSGVLLISLSGCSKSEETPPVSIKEIDNKFDTTLASINTTLEKNAKSENINSIIKKLKFDSYSYTVHIFGPENNDTQLRIASNKRIEQVIRKYGSI